jgi:hypothetical protein
MFKRIEKWLESKADEAAKEEYDNGYGYAATQILKYGYDMDDLDPMFDGSRFDRGMADATTAIADLQYKAKKLERIQAENQGLRDIVEGMQGEITLLLQGLNEVSTPQALSDVTESSNGPRFPRYFPHTAPFDPSDLPEWTNWVAQDEDGMWYAYEKKPTCGRAAWREDSEDGRTENISRSLPNADWKIALYKHRKILLTNP